MSETIKCLIKRLKSPIVLTVIGLAGIVLIFLSTVLGGSGKKAVSKSNTINSEEYRVQLEDSVRKIVSEITGSSRATVVVTLESSVRYDYADATDTSSASRSEQDTESGSREEKQTYITVRTSDGGEQALLVTEYMPEVRGVAIVCEGGDVAESAEKIKSAVMAALGITSKRVYIAGGSSYEKG